jgi:hypothetical protein
MWGLEVGASDDSREDIIEAGEGEASIWGLEVGTG